VARTPWEAYLHSVSGVNEADKARLLTGEVHAALGGYGTASLFEELYRAADGPDSLSTTMSVSTFRVVDWLLFNFSHHVEHHLFPSMSPRYYPLVRQSLAAENPAISQMKAPDTLSEVAHEPAGVRRPAVPEEIDVSAQVPQKMPQEIAALLLADVLDEFTPTLRGLK
jgi:hypothetical protein